ncbi:MAG: hypothetical protein GW748_02505 [Alphaproteobacteria bacterium]|nr:hypothetical protein [Alphaproteobacteria bacterium]NCQ66599.1 hypothetical protein [Alphaproteobacteria bacterium]NCT06951.1 hypothetical protein [Alphaproteobacteria bacterium]
MKKRSLSFGLVTGALLAVPMTGTASLPHAAMAEPFIELEAMKLFCTVRVDLSQSNIQIAREIEPTVSSLNWTIRLHPEADSVLQNRFESIMQLVANNLGEVVCGFEPQTLAQEAEQRTQREEPVLRETPVYKDPIQMRPRATLLTSFSIGEEAQINFKESCNRVEQENDDPLDALSFPSSPSGGDGIQENRNMFGGMSFDSFAFVSAFPSSKVNAFKGIAESDIRVDKGVSPAYPRLSKVCLPPKTPEPTLQKGFKFSDFLNKLQKIAVTNWLKAEVLSPFMAGVLLLVTYLRGDVLLPRATALLYRRRQRGLSF